VDHQGARQRGRERVTRMPADRDIATLSRPEHRLDIQALRGIAVLLVVFYHAGADWLPAGYLGVDVFFASPGSSLPD
jgi:uncharacterized membrane protein